MTLPDSAMATLSKAELERGRKFLNTKRQQQFYCARAMLRFALQSHTGVPATAHELSVSETGKPLCVDGPAVSIAHTGELVVCAVADEGEIGIDIEAPNGRRDSTKIARRYFAPEETRWLDDQPADRFYMLWTLKEAWLKSSGIGIAGGLDRLRCAVNPPLIDARIDGSPTPLLSLYGIGDAFVGVATSSASHDSLTVNRWNATTGEFITDDDVRFIASTSE